MILTWIQTIEDESERESIARIFELYYPRMQAVAYDILHNREDAEDAAMNAIKYMCEHSERFLAPTTPQTVGLIFICVKSAAIDIYRKNKRTSNLFVSLDHVDTENTSNSVPDLIIAKETKEMLSDAIEDLDDSYKIPILLKYGYEIKNKEIAKLTHLDVNTVNGRIFRAKKILKEKMEALGYTI